MNRKSTPSFWGVIALLFGMTVFSINAHAHFFKRLNEAKPRYAKAVWFAPDFDFDKDGCLPDAGISRKGQQNGGLKPSGSLGGHCRHGGFMGLSNTYHRYVCKKSGRNNYCAHVYALYFQKDMAAQGGIGGFGHRHDWENVVVWTRNGRPTHSSVSAHGKLSTRAWRDTNKWGNHPHVVYHKGVATHSFRMAKSGEWTAENPTHKWVRPALASWYTMKGDVSNATLTNNLHRFNYGNANLPVKHERMLRDVNRFKPSGYPSYSSQDMWRTK
ncbi:Necrosis inducing protein (NPP1) [Vibrio aerogenes CECT 7868]|uniref:Necrosis inducing protein (NPP1) n=1 Tax=Vibrio aerogenes CECT 7868 TaxID=1216006 RepID=A0A1M6B4X9_9VIBR|nr:NPP1 family protein [Vibrio aerogenes]SHI43829.1 Necrosis inducing protein (NPP1) [Vibrio aerogenes CECT 7868]